MDPISNADIEFFKEEPLVAVEDEFGASFFLILRNFALNGSRLNEAHVTILRDWVAPYIAKPVGFAEIYGMTDRSGTKKVNYKISGERVLAVQQSLKGFGATPTKVEHRWARGFGEDYLEYRHAQDKNVLFSDGRQDASYRIVVIALTPAPLGIPTRGFRARVAADVVSFCRLAVLRSHR